MSRSGRMRNTIGAAGRRPHVDSMNAMRADCVARNGRENRMSGYVTKGLAALAVGVMVAVSHGGVAHASGHSGDGGGSDMGSYTPGESEANDASAGVMGNYSAPETGSGGGVPQFHNDGAESDQMTGAMMMPGTASGSEAPGMSDGGYSNMHIGGEDSSILPGVD